MPCIDLTTVIAAPIERVFDLARSIDVHQESQTSHREKAVAGKTSGLIEKGESVTWEATHFGFRQTLTSKIVALERPVHFRDSMLQGAFKRLDHDHYFETTAAGHTLMKDVFDYTSPLGFLGRFADLLFLKRYLCNLLRERNTVIKRMAEQPTPAADGCRK